MMPRLSKILIVLGLPLFVAACTTFYQKTLQIQTQIVKGNFDQADKMLAQDKKWPENNHRVLYFMNRGMVSFMLGEYQQSIDFLNQADYYIEDYRKSAGQQALALISNPMVTAYKPEDFETIMVNFYKALGFLELHDMESALVEVKRININLLQLNDKYADNKNKYQRDAFAYNLMGMILDAAGEYNDAFIAYRNALEAYEEDYTSLFGMPPPTQLKKDLIWTAQKTGFGDQVAFYKDKFQMQSPAMREDSTGELVFLWLNGMGPVKSEWALTLSNFGLSNGYMNMGNPELGLNYSFYVGNRNNNELSAFKNLSFLRVAFPKYVERPPLFTNAGLEEKGTLHDLEIAEDINKIAFQCLRDRMVREVGNSLLRMATKRVMEELAQKENKNLGTIVSIVNAMTEKADTRNWQSLPHSIYYTRISLPPGQHTLSLHLYGPTEQNRPLTVNIEKGQTTFFTFHTLSSQ